MRKPLSKIILISLLVLTLPLALFFYREMTSLSDNEKIIRKVFNKQLESILFSLNQQTETLLRIWVSRLEATVSSEPSTMDAAAKQLMENNPAILSIQYFHLDLGEELTFVGQPEVSASKKAIYDNAVVEQLKYFLQNNFQKIAVTQDENQTKLFFLQNRKDENILCAIWIDPQSFIDNNLSPEMQKAAQDMFAITISKLENNTQVNVSDSTKFEEQLVQSKPVYYLPGYQFNIRLKSKTIDELVSERTLKDNLMLMAMAIIVLIGSFFIIWNIRSELKMAEMKSEFVSNVSHELRTPLALVNMYAETLLLKRLKNKEREEEYLRVIHSEAQRLSDLVNQILSFSRMERGKRDFHFEKYDINELVSQVTTGYKEHLEKSDVTFNVKLMPNSTIVCVDKDAVTESLINLLDNAVKYGRAEGKTIEVRTNLHLSMAIVEVEDNGIGISNHDKKKIFDKFYRVSQGNLAHVAKGSGLGLNIVQQIMKQHHGKVSVQSKLGDGSTFRLHFPLSKNECYE
jgi:two-component system, OmpR family, phosphate regulon sensor histidine kinase PhoR